MNDTSVKAVIASLMIALVGFACGTESPAGTARRSTTLTTETPCSAPKLNPSYLPPGFESFPESRLIESAEWWNTWRGDDRQFQVLGGFSADRGDDPTVKHATVRGKEAQYGPIPLQEGTYSAVNWDEESECGSHQYAVVGRGVSDKELLRIANSLEDD